MVNQQNFFGGALDGGGDSVAVARPEDQRLQDEKIQCPLEQLNTVSFFAVSHW